MVDNAATNAEVDAKIKNFLERKAVQYPKLGLAVLNPKVIESTLKPVHEVIADQLLEKNSKNLLNHLMNLLKYYPASSYGRVH